MPEPPVQRRLAAIAIADVVGYSRMMGVDEAGTLAAVNSRHQHVIAPIVASHQGRIVKLMGDGFFLEFSSAVSAVEAAMEIQARMAEANAGLPAERRLVLRIGINLGEVIVQGEDLYGDGVNVAARLEGIAPAGGIALSASTHEQVQGRVTASIRELGPRTLKNIAQPVQVYAIGGEDPPSTPPSAAAAAPPATAPPGTADAGRLSIAILPFANLGGDPDQGFFSDGITEDIITELSRWRSLAVRSRSASFRFRDPGLNLGEVARELDARYLVEGSVRRMGRRLRITAQLIDTSTGSHVWAEKFDRDADDIFEVQDEVVRTIVSTLVGRAQAADAERARRKPPTSLAAYECVLEGNALPWDTPEGAAEATALFEKAVELDPGYGFAYAMLAAMRYGRWYDDFDSTPELLDQAQALGERAVALDENESTCHSMLAWVTLMQRKYDLALQLERRAVELNPTNQWNTADMGGLLVYLGDTEQALGWLQRAREIDPYLSVPWYWRCRGQALMMLGRYEEALADLERASVAGYRVLAYRAGCLARLGREAEADAARAQCLRLKPDFSVGRFMAHEPLRRAVDVEQQTQSLLLAGFPA